MKHRGSAQGRAPSELRLRPKTGSCERDQSDRDDENSDNIAKVRRALRERLC
jgi:hypothetical protein